MNEDNTLTYVLLAGAALAIGLPAVMWDKALTWCLEHDLIVRSAADPLITIPHANGAGLDLRRVLVVVAVLVVASVLGARQLRTRTEETA